MMFLAVGVSSSMTAAICPQQLSIWLANQTFSEEGECKGEKLAFNSTQHSPCLKRMDCSFRL